jgi:hypothetical protein
MTRLPGTRRVTFSSMYYLETCFHAQRAFSRTRALKRLYAFQISGERYGAKAQNPKP